MHEIETIEGDLNVRSTDWIQTDRAGARYIRPDGYNGTPTAELVATALGWVGSSWIMQPRREIWIPRDTPVDWAVYHLEIAEGLGQGAPAWLPLSQPNARGCGGPIPFSDPGRPRRWMGMANGHCLTFIEATGPAGLLRYLVVIDSVPLTGRDGEMRVLTDLVDAQYDAEMEVTR